MTVSLVEHLKNDRVHFEFDLLALLVAHGPDHVNVLVVDLFLLEQKLDKCMALADELKVSPSTKDHLKDTLFPNNFD